MEIQVNWLAVVLATLSTMVVGGVWYTKGVFGTKWMKLLGKKEKDLPQSMAPMVTTLLVTFITAIVLAHMTYMAAGFYDVPFLHAALTTALWAWLGFTAARMITHDAFEGRPKALTLMNITHELVTFVVMGLVIGLMGV